MIKESIIYKNRAHYLINTLLFPLKMLVPQPIVMKLPGLLSNLDIRTRLILSQVSGRLLDIGCGENTLARNYQQQGGDGTGVDVYDWGDVDLLVEDTSKLPLEDGSVDTITFVACLNHIPNRIDVLKESDRLLAPGGRVVLTNLAPLISRIWHEWAFWDDDQHERGMVEGEVYGFTDKELREVLAEGGFKVVESRGFSWGFNRIYICEKIL